MSNPVISVEGLGKCYRLRHVLSKHDGLRHVLNHVATHPLAWLRRKAAVRRQNAAVEDFWALRDVSFDIQPGEVVGIIGRNGAGKSTLLKVLSRITEPTEGRVRIRGRVASLLEVGTGFHPELTGRENIFLNGSILGMSRAEIRARFDEMVAFAEVEKFLDTPVKRYSSGMYVRLAFAVAAHLEPEILIVDEVLAVGDAEFQKKCLGKMESVARGQGRTILFVSHDLKAVERLTTRAIVLSQGKTIFAGPTGQAISAYLGASSAASGWLEDFTRVQRPMWGTGSGVIERVWFPARSSRFEFGKDLAVGVRVRCAAALDSAVLAVTVLGGDLKPIGTCFSAAPFSLAAGETADLEIHLNDHSLAPGQYSLDVAVLQEDWLGSTLLHDIVKNVLHFDIDPPLNRHGMAAGWLSTYWGETSLPAGPTRKLPRESAPESPV